jgi:uncharacterized membrane protein YdbT with pleckstrin-like domain
VLRPHPLFVVLSILGRLAGIAGLASMLASLAGWVGAASPIWLGLRVTPLAIWLVALASALTLIAWQGLEWVCRIYVLTDRRVVRVTGVLRQHIADIPLERVQNLIVYRSIRERVFGLGTVGISAAGTAWPEIAWVMLGHPDRVLGVLRASVGRPGHADGVGAEPAVGPAPPGGQP